MIRFHLALVGALFAVMLSGCATLGAGDPNEDIERAREYLKAGQLEQAHKILSRVDGDEEIRRKRDHVQIQVALRAGRGKEALQILERYDGSTSFPLQWDYAKALLLLGRDTEALVRLRKLWPIAPEELRRAVGLQTAELALKRNELKLAERIYTSLKPLYPDDPELFLGAVRLLILQGKPAVALKQLRGYVSGHPADTKSQMLLGGLLANSNFLTEARTVFLGLVEEDSENSPAWRSLGFVELKLGQHADAVSSFEEALRGLPDDPSITNNLAVAYAGVGRFEEARLWILKAVALGQHPGTIWGNYLTILLEQGQIEEASQQIAAIPSRVLVSDVALEALVFRIRLLLVVSQVICSGQGGRPKLSNVTSHWNKQGYPRLLESRARSVMSDPTFALELTNEVQRCEDTRYDKRSKPSPKKR
tara:strand:- start:294 stop:1556 length:1263 start_codon:yes stop_codon:yes gene_type:complete